MHWKNFANNLQVLQLIIMLDVLIAKGVCLWSQYDSLINEFTLALHLFALMYLYCKAGSVIRVFNRPVPYQNDLALTGASRVRTGHQ